LINVLDKLKLLSQGIRAVGFVHLLISSSGKKLIFGLSHVPLPVTVYNTNSYDKTETLKSLSGLIDVYLPDFKYISSELAADYSDAADIREVALKSD